MENRQNHGFEPITFKYCLYARKSSDDSTERQALSIDSQIREMLQIAQRDGLNIIDMKRESHSAKDTGQRPIFNEMIKEIREGRFNAILTWHPDRLSRNAGDLSAIVDLIDQGKILEVKTYQQKFSNLPSDKFLLMILGSQAKLENDNKSINVKRGLRMRCELGLWPAPAPIGYVNSTKVGERGVVYVDPKRAPIVRKIFEKAGYENWSGRRIYFWLRDDIKLTSPRGKPLTLSNVYLVLRSHFYHGQFEYPQKSSRWYQGKHEPLIDKALFDLVQEKTTVPGENHAHRKEFAFTDLMKCGICGSGVTAIEKFKKLSKGGVAKYIYYTCTRFNDKNCPNDYMREEDLIEEFGDIIDALDLDQIGLKEKIKFEVERYNAFQNALLSPDRQKKVCDVDIKAYAKYILKAGSLLEKRGVMEHLKSKILLNGQDIGKPRLVLPINGIKNIP